MIMSDKTKYITLVNFNSNEADKTFNRTITNY